MVKFAHAGVAAAAGHLLASGGHLAQRVGVGGHVRQDDQHVLAALVRQVLRRLLQFAEVYEGWRMKFIMATAWSMDRGSVDSKSAK